jgi:uncharacterized protein YtpQ (UPF0354 family)
MKTSIIIVFFACLALIACKEKALSAAQFSEVYATAIRAHDKTIVVTQKADLELQLESPGRKEYRAYLDNAYNAYLQDPGDMAKIVDRYANATIELSKPKAIVIKTQIVPIVKDRKWVTDVAQSLKDRGATKPLETIVDSINESLVIAYAEDSPTSIRYLTNELLAETGVGRSELRGLAIANLKRLLTDIKINNLPLFAMVTAGGDYEASVILLDDVWTSEKMKFEGDPVFVIPARDVFLVTGSSNRAGVQKIRELSKSISAKGPYSLTDQLFVYRGGRIALFE